MLGLIGKWNVRRNNMFAVVPGKNPYRVNLQPWDCSIETEVSPKHPDGIKVTPAATQEDFAKLIKEIPHMIGELTPAQEAEALKSLRKGCAWFKEKEAKEKELKAEAKNTFLQTEKQ